MKTKAFMFMGSCSGCQSSNDTPSRGALYIQLDASQDVEDGELVCLDCAERTARRIKARVRQCREKMAQGLVYRFGKWQQPKAEEPTANAGNKPALP